MERRYQQRKQEMLAECKVSPQVFRGMVDRMREFLQPFVSLLANVVLDDWWNSRGCP